MRSSLLLSILLGFVPITACGGGDDGGTTEPPDPLELTAVWQLSTTVSSNTCGLPDGGTSTDRIILMQCGGTASVIAGPGLWGTATISGQNVNINGTETQTDDTGCRTTHQSTGSVSGTSTLLEGTLTTNVTFDQVSCGPTEACIVETATRLSSPTRYLDGCLGRDVFGNPPNRSTSSRGRKGSPTRLATATAYPREAIGSSRRTIS